MQSFILMTVSFLSLSVCANAFDSNPNNIPKIIRTGTVHGEANGVPAPWAVNELAQFQDQSEKRVAINAVEIKELAEKKSASIINTLLTTYTPAVKAHVPKVFSRIMEPKLLNRIGFKENEDNLQLAQHFIKLALDIKTYIPKQAWDRDKYISYAYVLAADHLKSVQRQINMMNTPAKQELGKHVLAAQLDLVISRGQLLSWAHRYTPDDEEIKTDMIKLFAQVASSLPLVSAELRIKYQPIYAKWFATLNEDDKTVAQRIITQQVIKSFKKYYNPAKQ